MIDEVRAWLARKICPQHDCRERPPQRGRPMHEFFTLGWLNELNRKVANPEGVHVGMYLNADPLPDGTMDDGLLVHGWESIPLEHAQGLVIAPDDVAVELEAAWRHHVAEVRRRA